jgi:hypothetical protein
MAMCRCRIRCRSSDGNSLRASESPVIRKATSALLALTIVASAVIIDGIAARYYFYSNWIRLENAAEAAAAAGSLYLPANPAMALKTAHQYAALNGVRPEEIVSATVAPDDSTIAIRLQRTMPFYLSGAGVGQSSAPVTAYEEAHAPRTPPAHSRWIEI